MNLTIAVAALLSLASAQFVAQPDKENQAYWDKCGNTFKGCTL